jgi:hypothetical protein
MTISRRCDGSVRWSDRMAKLIAGMTPSLDGFVAEKIDVTQIRPRTTLWVGVKK